MQKNFLLQANATSEADWTILCILVIIRMVDADKNKPHLCNIIIITI